MLDKTIIVSVSLEINELLITEASSIFCRCYEYLKSHDKVLLSKVKEGFDYD